MKNPPFWHENCKCFLKYKHLFHYNNTIKTIVTDDLYKFSKFLKYEGEKE